jgi:hypothetical protein
MAWTGLIWLRIRANGGGFVNKSVNFRFQYNVSKFMSSRGVDGFWCRAQLLVSVGSRFQTVCLLAVIFIPLTNGRV